MESSSFSGSSKRAKAFGTSIPQIANCLVDGCTADLSLCRDYHRRHKVCEMHSKTACVTIGGRDQRFCQQCSRFHSLGEFDEGKRSCRKRLDGHNRRRRKPQPDSNIPRNNPALVISSTQNTGLLSFSTPHSHSTPVNTSSTWSNVIKSEDNTTAFYNNQQQAIQQNEFPEYSTQSYTRANRLQLIQSGNTVLGSKMYNEGFNEAVDCDDRALSLLSSAPQQMVHRKERPESQSLGHNLQYGGGLGHYNPFAQEDKVIVSSMDSSVTDVPTLQFSEMFQQGHVGSSASEPHQTLTFTWE